MIRVKELCELQHTLKSNGSGFDFRRVSYVPHSDKYSKYLNLPYEVWQWRCAAQNLLREGSGWTALSCHTLLGLLAAHD